MAFSCFRLKDTSDYFDSEPKEYDNLANDSFTVNQAPSTANAPSASDAGFKTGNNNGTVSIGHSPACSSSSKSGSVGHTTRLRQITTFRNAGFANSPFSACVSHPNKKQDKSEYDPELESQSSSTGSCFGSASVQVVKEVGTANVSSLQASRGLTCALRERGLGCLVRSHSDSTCLSLKAAQPVQNTITDLATDAGPQLDDVLCASSSSHLDSAACTAQHSSSSELNTSAARLFSNDQEQQNDDLLARGTSSSGSFSTCASETIPPNSSPQVPKPAPLVRSYQLVCRDGIQRYELISVSNMAAHAGADIILHASDSSPATPDAYILGQVSYREPSASTSSTNAPRLKAHLVAGPNRQGVDPPNQSTFYSSQPTSSYTSGSTNQCAASDVMRGSVLPQKNVSNSHGAPSGVQLMHVTPNSYATHIATSGSRVNPNTPFNPVVQTTTTTVKDEAYFGNPQQSRYDKPTAPLPSRKQRTTSPPSQMPTPATHARPSYSSVAHQHPSDRISTRNAWPAALGRTPYVRDAIDSMYGQADSSSSSFISNQHSGESSDFATPSSPISKPRPSMHAELQSSGAVASTTHGFVSPQPSQELRVKQATLISAPSGNVHPYGTADEVSSIQRKTAAITSPSHPFSGAYNPCESSSQMTVGELRSIAERQRQQLTRQAQQMQTKEERLAWLRSVRAQSSGQEKLPPAGCELTHEQEARLHKLRSFRGQAEQTRLTNENLVKEIDNYARMLSAKELELANYHRRTDDSQRLLSLIRTCHGTLANSSTTRNNRLTTMKSPDLNVPGTAIADLDKPLDLLSVQLPFPSERDKKRWRDGLIEADRLDRQITLALSHRTHSKRGPMQDTKLEPTPPPRPHATSTAVIPAIGSVPPASKYHVAGEKPGAVTVNTCTPDGTCTKPSAVSSSFSSLLTRASSPPTSRRSSLRMLLHAASGDSPRALDPNTPLQRIKTPPRYASRAVINDTYMRRICRDSVEKYKRTASEIYRANVERMAAKQGKSSSRDVRDSQAEERVESSTTDILEPGEVRLMRDELDRLELEKVLGRTQSTSPMDSISSSSSSSLELVGIDQTAADATKSTEPQLSPVDEETKQNSGDVDSGLGGSDDTGQSEQAHNASQSKKLILTPSLPAATVLVDEGHGTDASLSNTSVVDGSPNHIKSILRKSSSKRSTSDTTSVTDAACAQSQSSNSVRFHPLALLLDAALEGDLELVKKVSAEVSDVSEPNDEGITALHNAVCAGRTEIAEFLVRTAGADVNAGDTDGWTPLHCAASCANLPLARLLVEHGASLHARTLSDQETPLEKCDQGDEEAECEEYLFFQQERLGSAASGRVYALFPRGLESAGPGSIDAHLEHDELPVYPNEPLTVVDRKPAGETEWMLAEKADGTRGLIPRSHISCYPLVRVPPASMPVPIPTVRPKRYEFWDEDDDVDRDREEESNPVRSELTNLGTNSPNAVVEVELPCTESPKSRSTSAPVTVLPISRPTFPPSSTTIVIENGTKTEDAETRDLAACLDSKTVL